ncbi:MAG: MFS transporter [Bacillota bacterium]
MGPFHLFRRSISLLLWSALVLGAAKFSVTAFLAVYLSQILRLPAWQTGTILSTALIVNYALPAFSGAVTDRIGYRTAMALGCGFIGAGYSLFALSGIFPLLVLAAFFVGLGSALFDPSLRAALGHLPKALRKRAFTGLNLALNGGAVLGAGLGGGAVSLFNEKSPLIIGALLSLALAASFLMLGSHLPGGSPSGRLRQTIRNVFSNRRFLRFSLTMSLYWIMYAQLTMAFPLQMFHLTRDSRWSGLIILTNGLFALLFMFLVRRRLEQTGSLERIRIGFAITAAGLAAVPLQASTAAWVILCVLLFTIGETFALPGMDIAVAEFSRSRDTAAHYGVFELSFALGGSLGSYMGAVWMERWGETAWPWILLSLPGIAGFFLMRYLVRDLRENPGGQNLFLRAATRRRFFP